MKNLWITFPVYKNDPSVFQKFATDLIEVRDALSYTTNVRLVAIHDGFYDKRIEKIYNDHPIKVIRHEKNRGVVKALYSSLGYVLNSDDGTGFIAWLDSDGEHNPHDLIRIFEIVRSGQSDIALTQVVYQSHHRSQLDTMANTFLGAMQGEFLFGKNEHFLHNCPGCWIAKIEKNFLRDTLLLYLEYMKYYKEKTGEDMRWGEDMTFYAIATFLGKEINRKTLTQSTIPAPNRDFEKILNQATNNLTHLKLYPDFFKKNEK